MASQVASFDDGSVLISSNYLPQPSLGSDQKDAEAQTVDRSAGDHLRFDTVLVEHAEVLYRWVAAHDDPSWASIGVAAGVHVQQVGAP